jgi:hypothetical protein
LSHVIYLQTNHRSILFQRHGKGTRVPYTGYPSCRDELVHARSACYTPCTCTSTYATDQSCSSTSSQPGTALRRGGVQGACADLLQPSLDGITNNRDGSACMLPVTVSHSSDNTSLRFTFVRDVLISHNDTTSPLRVALDMLIYPQSHPGCSAHGDGFSTSGRNSSEQTGHGASVSKDSSTRDPSSDDAARKRAKVSRSSKACVQVRALHSAGKEV